MTTVTIDLPEMVFSAIRLAPNEFVRDMRIAAAVQWYVQETVSQGKAAECLHNAWTTRLHQPHGLFRIS
jgi:Uncharacterised protein family (UPF0175)